MSRVQAATTKITEAALRLRHDKTSQERFSMGTSPKDTSGGSPHGVRDPKNKSATLVRGSSTEGKRGARSDTAYAVDQHVGKQIRLRRVILGLAQTEVSERLGITFQQLQKYEHGSNRVSASSLYSLAEILHVKPGYFFEGLPDIEDIEPGPRVAPQDNRRTMRILAAFNGLEHEALMSALLRLVSLMSDIEETNRSTPEFLK